MFAAATTVKDDPEAHQGRTRSFAHVRGNWATHIHVDIAAVACSPEWQEEMARELSKRLAADGVVQVKMESVTDPHVSLSKVVVLKVSVLLSIVTPPRIALSARNLQLCSELRFSTTGSIPSRHPSAPPSLSFPSSGVPGPTSART